MKKNIYEPFPSYLDDLMEQQRKMFDSFSTLIPKASLPPSFVERLGNYGALHDLVGSLPKIDIPENLIPTNNWYTEIEKVFPKAAINLFSSPAMDALSKSLLANQKMFSDIASTYTNVLPTLYPSFKAFPAFTPEIVKNEQISPKYGLAAHGWFISKVFPEQEEILVVFKRGKVTTEGINEYFVDFYYKNNCEKLKRLLEVIVEHNALKERRQILKECKQIIELCEDKKIACYTTIIPFLQAQIDVALEVLYKKYDDSKADVGFADKAICMLVVSTLVTKDQIAAHCISSFLLNNDTQNYGIERIHAVDINRHKVMHGKSITYGHKANLVRILTMYHFILDLISLALSAEQKQSVKNEIVKKKRIYIAQKKDVNLLKHTKSK
ncbi:MAG: hypothetical protein LBI01_01710 [Elusimicrobium sp.]|jgi:hypothetical protein|nr:hypothetical protein [Elusimicrobium sp.]